MGDEASTTLQPGQSIKPNLSLEEAKELIKEHFGQDVSSIKELNSYDDKNYYVKVNKNSTNCTIFICIAKP
jgi:hydroxylysine kinase